MNETYRTVTALLGELEWELRELDLWSSEPPPAEALASHQPFCVDTLRFEQWLQFIFIERMGALLQEGAPLPHSSGVTPMAEEYFRGSSMDVRGLIDTLAAMDRALNS